MPLKIIIIEPIISNKSGKSRKKIKPNINPANNWEYWIGANTLDSNILADILIKRPAIPKRTPHKIKI